MLPAVPESPEGNHHLHLVRSRSPRKARQEGAQSTAGDGERAGLLAFIVRNLRSKRRARARLEAWAGAAEVVAGSPLGAEGRGPACLFVRPPCRPAYSKQFLALLCLAEEDGDGGGRQGGSRAPFGGAEISGQPAVSLPDRRSQERLSNSPLPSRKAAVLLKAGQSFKPFTI